MAGTTARWRAACVERMLSPHTPSGHQTVEPEAPPMRNTSIPRAAIAAFALVATSAAASPAVAQIAPGSTLFFSGMADATDIGGMGVLLDFTRHVTADPTANTGAFASLNEPHGPAVGSIETMRVGTGPQQVGKVVHFGPYRFDLEYLPSGQYGQDDCYVMPEVGQRCTPYQFPSYELSPFYLENVAASGDSDALFTALVSFDVVGQVTARGETTDFRGTLTATFEGLSYQEALAGLEQSGLENVPFTGMFVAGTGTSGLRPLALSAAATTVTPEPSTAALVAIGLAGVAGVARRRRSRRG